MRTSATCPRSRSKVKETKIREISRRSTHRAHLHTAGADLVTVDWLFDIVDIGSPDIIVGPSILAMSGINIRNYRKNGETIMKRDRCLLAITVRD